MNACITNSHPVFPSPDIERTAEFYVAVLGFRAVKYLDVKEPHICLYRDNTEIILTSANTVRVYPNKKRFRTNSLTLDVS